MLIEILSVGDELLQGKIVNSNASFLCKELTKEGFSVVQISTVGDTVEKIVEALHLATQRAKIVIVTGGLGPTNDDVTCEAICQFLNVKTVLHPPSLENMQKRFEGRGLTMPSSNVKQAMLPEGCSVLANLHGTAPGFCCAKEECYLYAMPGVPHEMKAMFYNFVLPEIIATYNPKPCISLQYRTTGISESLLYNKLSCMDWITPQARVSFLPGGYGVDVEIQLPHDFPKDQIEAIQKRMKVIDDFVYSNTREDLEERVAQVIMAQGKTIAIAESSTGGLLLHRLSSIPGSEKFLKQGVVVCNEKEAILSLGVSLSTLEKYGTVSKECVREMAYQIRLKADTDIALATAGIPKGVAYAAFLDEKKCEVEKSIFPDALALHKERNAQMALRLLWKNLTFRIRA